MAEMCRPPGENLTAGISAGDLENKKACGFDTAGLCEFLVGLRKD
jgi:hypothetical protein